MSSLEDRAIEEIYNYLAREGIPHSMEDHTRRSAQQIFTTARDAARETQASMELPLRKQTSLPPEASRLSASDLAELESLLRDANARDDARAEARGARHAETIKGLMRQAFTGSYVSEETARALVEDLCAGN